MLGSPIYFPNYKVPFLIEEVGLELLLQADYTTLSTQDCRLERMQKERIEKLLTQNEPIAFSKKLWKEGYCEL